MKIDESKVNIINWLDEFERFKRSCLNSFGEEYLNRFEYSEVHHKYFILPKGFDYGENNLGDFISDIEHHLFERLNFGWDMWVGSLLEVRL